MTAEEAIKEIDERIVFAEKEYSKEVLEYIEALKIAIEALKKVQDYETQWADDSINPLEPLKLSAALDCELLILKRRMEKNPKDISILDYTVIAALEDCLKRYAGEKGAREDEA